MYAYSQSAHLSLQEQYQQLVYQSLQHHSVAAAGIQPPGTPTSQANSTSHNQQRGAPSSAPHTPHRGSQGTGFTPQRPTPGKSTPADKSKEKS